MNWEWGKMSVLPYRCSFLIFVPSLLNTPYCHHMTKSLHRHQLSNWITPQNTIVVESLSRYLPWESQIISLSSQYQMCEDRMNMSEYVVLQVSSLVYTEFSSFSISLTRPDDKNMQRKRGNIIINKRLLKTNHMTGYTVQLSPLSTSRNWRSCHWHSRLEQWQKGKSDSICKEALACAAG